MAGLSLIGTYSSDLEDEDDEEESASATENNTKQQSILPLPASILLWKGVEHHEEVNDNPSEHDGRIRSFKHERGNWATLVYFEYEPEEAVKAWMKSVSGQLPFEGKYLFHQFHLSLTRTLALKFHWIESFVDSVKELCKETEQFIISLSDVEVYCNDDRTRTFLAIRCTPIDDSLNRLIQALDKILADYQLPAYYKDASFHISFMWQNGDVEEQLKDFLLSLSMTLSNVFMENSGRRITVDQLHCKIGNKMYAFPLKQCN